jgi:Ni2+-binding GTPase involved in maturation of urease and hydrogenase
MLSIIFIDFCCMGTICIGARVLMLSEFGGNIKLHPTHIIIIIIIISIHQKIGRGRMVPCLERSLCLLVMLNNLLSRRCVAWTWVSQTQHVKHHRQLKTRTIGTQRQKNWLQVSQRPLRLQQSNFSTNPIDPTESESDKPIIPITILSGFLGSGKTTLLQHMLSHNEGLKIAVVVNDVASVNIDSKLVRGQSTAASPDDGAYSDADSNESSPATPAGIVELQNGCACCSLSGELLTSVSELLTLSDMRHDDEKFDHIIVEMSGMFARGMKQSYDQINTHRPIILLLAPDIDRSRRAS